MTANSLCRGLLARGHHVSVLAGFIRKGVLGWQSSIQRRILRQSFLRDRKCGYPVWRSWSPDDAFEQVAREESPEVVVALAPIRMGHVAKDAGFPTIIRLTGVGGLEDNVDYFKKFKAEELVANSQFTADRFEKIFGYCVKFIYPVIDRELYETKTNRSNVTFINPIQAKGVDIAIAISENCRDIPFVFVKGWSVPSERRRELARRLAGRANVTLLETQSDMRRVYKKSNILLAPSFCEEAYGRVVTEAQISGIPAVVSARGGLPEAVGPGGIVVDPDGPIDRWIGTIRKLWDDEGHYAELSAAARRHAARPEVDFNCQIDAWEEILLTAVRRASIAPVLR